MNDAYPLPPAVRDYVENHTVRIPGVSTYLVSEEGRLPLFNTFKAGYPYTTPAELADWTRVHRPELWK